MAEPAPSTRLPDVALSAALLTVMLVTFGSGTIAFYLFWLSGLAISLLYLAKTLAKLNLRKDVLVTLGCMGSWLIYALAVSFDVANLPVHFKMIALTAFYITAATAALSILLRDVNTFARTFQWITLAWMLVNSLVFLMYAAGYVEYEGRSFSGLYFNRNTLAIVGCFIFGFWLTLGNTGRGGNWTWVRIGALLLTGLLVLASASMKGLVGLLLATAIFVWLRYRGFKTIALSIGLLLAGSALVVYAEAGRRFQQNVFATEEGATNLERVALILESVDVVKDEPMTGVGVHNSQYYLLTERHFQLLRRGSLDNPEVGSYSHVNYLEMILNAGWPALLLYYVPIVLLLITTVRARVQSTSERRVRELLLILLSMKLAFDFAMVSYYEMSHIIVLALAFLAQQRFLAHGRGPGIQGHKTW
jgi:hypothetical protein